MMRDKRARKAVIGVRVVETGQVARVRNHSSLRVRQSLGEPYRRIETRGEVVFAGEDKYRRHD